VRSCVHGVYEGMRAATNFRDMPSDPAFRYGTNEIRDGLLAVQCDCMRAVMGSSARSQIGLRKADGRLQETTPWRRRFYGK